MREIKFRAYIPEEDGFAYSDACRGYWFMMSKVGGLAIVDRADRQLPSMDWQQYIGYADINKVDIYEGDILKDMFNRVMLVERRKGGFCFKALTETNFKYAHLISQWFEFDMEPPLIIGNVYESPEWEWAAADQEDEVN